MTFRPGDAPWNKGLTAAADGRVARIGASIRRRYREDPTYRAKIRATNWARRPEVRARLSAAQRRRFQDPAKRAAHKAGVRRHYEERRLNKCYPPGHRLKNDRWEVHLWRDGSDDWIARSRFRWVAELGPIPAGWFVHHLDLGATLDDEPLVGTLAMPHAEHNRYHGLRDRRAAGGLLARRFRWWADRLRARRKRGTT